MTNADFESINKRLDAIIMILLNQTKFQEETLKEKISRLNSFGFDSNEIALILGTTAGLVSKERSLLKGGKK